MPVSKFLKWGIPQNRNFQIEGSLKIEISKIRDPSKWKFPKRGIPQIRNSWICSNVNICNDFRYTMVNVHLACSYDKRILPYLYTPLAPPDELRLMGQDGEYVAVHPQLASTLLKLVMETSSVIVPDAPIAAMGELAELLHLGRYVLCQFKQGCILWKLSTR